MDFDAYKASARREVLLKEAEQERLADIAQARTARRRLPDLLRYFKRIPDVRIAEQPIGETALEA